MWRLANEREQARRQNQDMAAQQERVQAELTELRHRPPQRASFRDLGPTVDQILALAEKQAKTITDIAAERAARHQAEADRVLAEARERADKLRADSEATYERAEQEAKRISEQSTQRIEQARAEAHGLVEAARSEAQQEVEAARAQTQQEVQARQQALTELHAELDTAQQHLVQSHQERAAAEREVEQLQQRHGEVSDDLAAELTRLDEARQAAESAERHAKQVRARVQREAERVAQLAAAAVMAAAERGTEPTGEYPLVVPVQPRADRTAGDTAELSVDEYAGRSTGGSHAWHDADSAVAAPRESESGDPPAAPAGAVTNGVGDEATEPPGGEVEPGSPAGGYTWFDPDSAVGTQLGPETGGYPLMAPAESGANGLGDRATEPPADEAAPGAGMSASGHGWHGPDNTPATYQEADTGEYTLAVPAEARASGVVDDAAEPPAGELGSDPATAASGVHAWREADNAVPTQRRPRSEDAAVEAD
jgi:chemotaxis protein histidine kinase CheA